MPKAAPEPDEVRKARQRREVEAYELDNDLVPGTAGHDGDLRGPSGGTPWEGKARMALAREAAGVPLNDVDREALTRYPEPGGWIGEGL